MVRVVYHLTSALAGPWPILGLRAAVNSTCATGTIGTLRDLGGKDSWDERSTFLERGPQQQPMAAGDIEALCRLLRTYAQEPLPEYEPVRVESKANQRGQIKGKSKGSDSIEARESKGSDSIEARVRNQSSLTPLVLGARRQAETRPSRTQERAIRCSRDRRENGFVIISTALFNSLLTA
jgi:hypothetical protein